MSSTLGQNYRTSRGDFKVRPKKKRRTKTKDRQPHLDLPKTAAHLRRACSREEAPDISLRLPAVGREGCPMVANGGFGVMKFPFLFYKADGSPDCSSQT